MAEALLELHIRFDLVERHVARPFAHDLDAAGPGALGQFPESEEFLDLGAVRRVSQAARTETVSQGDGDIVGFTNVQDIIVIFVKRIFFFVVEHPARNEAAAAADDVHDTAFLGQLFQDHLRNAAVDGEEIGAVFGLAADGVQHVLAGHFDNGPAFLDRIDGRLVDRHGPDHDRRRRENGPAGRVDVVPRGQVHDGIRPGVDGGFQLRQLRRRIGKRAGRAQIGVDLDFQAQAHAAGPQIFMVDVAGNGNHSLGHPFPDDFRVESFISGDCFHRRRNRTFSCPLHLCRHRDPSFCAARDSLPLPSAPRAALFRTWCG